MKKAKDRLARLESSQKLVEQFNIGDPVLMDAMPVCDREARLVLYLAEMSENLKRCHFVEVAGEAEFLSWTTVAAGAAVWEWVAGQRGWMDGKCRPPRTPAHFNDYLAWNSARLIWMHGAEHDPQDQPSAQAP